MFVNPQRFFLLVVGLLFCFLGCDTERSNFLQPDGFPSENVGSSLAATTGSTDLEASFEQNLLPILTARCAFVGCHVAGGPEGLDFSTYQTFIRGGDDVFTPGNARSSDIIEEIVSGRMPPGGPRLPDDQIQLFVDWINEQEPTTDNRGDDDDDDDDHDDDDNDDDDHDDDDDDDHDDDDD